MPKQKQQNIEALLTKIADAAKASGYLSSTAQPEREIRLFIGGKEVHKDDLTDKQAEKICQAIERPGSLENKRNNSHRGTVEIWLNSKGKVFRNEWGKLDCDLLQLVQNQKSQVEVAPNSEQFSTSGVKKHQQVAQVEKLATGEAQIQELVLLKQTLEQQAQRIEALEKKIALMSNSVEFIQNKSISQWLGTSVSHAAKGFERGVTEWAARKLGMLGQIQKPQPTRSVRYFDALDDLESDRFLENAYIKGNTKQSLQEQLKELKHKIQNTKDSFARGVATSQKALEIVSYQVSQVVKQSEPVVCDTLQRACDAVGYALDRADPLIERAIDNSEPFIRSLLKTRIGQRLLNFPANVGVSNQAQSLTYNAGNTPTKLSLSHAEGEQMIVDESAKPDIQNIKQIIEKLSSQRKNLAKLRDLLHRDCDNDGITDVQERLYGTNPYSVDTDLDGKTDLEELSSGTNARIPNTRERQNSSSKHLEEELEI